MAEAFEIAGARQDNTPGPLLDEHFIAIEAVEAISKSGLGADSVVFQGKRTILHVSSKENLTNGLR